MKAGIWAIGLAALIALTASAPAGGDGGEKTKIKIKKLAGSGAAGKVTSSARRCVGGKKVTLFRTDDFRSTKVEITKSNARGKWRTKKRLRPGRYFAKVDSSSGCRYAVSRFRLLR